MIPTSAARAKPPVFVLGLGENGYGAARSLGRAGVDVIGFHSEAKECGRYSRHVRACRLSPSLNDARTADLLIDHARRTGTKPMLLATSDRFAFLIAGQQERLQDHFLYHWVAPAGLSALADKAGAAQWCRRAGVPFPLTHVTAPGEDLEALGGVLPFPCLVKPRRSFDVWFPPGMKNFVAHTPQALVAFYRSHPHLLGATVCQQIIEGGDEDILQCTVLMPHHGAPVPFTVRKLHQYPPGYGVMCFGRSEDDATLCSQSLTLLRALGYRGLASLEFKHRRQDGRYYFIEMNPRLPWYNALFADAGVNLPLLAYLDLTGTVAREVPRQRNGVHWIGLKLDLGWYLRVRRARRVPLRKWIACVLRARSYAWFDPRDLGPFLRASVQLLQTAVRRLLHAGDPRASWRRLMRSRPTS